MSATTRGNETSTTIRRCSALALAAAVFAAPVTAAAAPADVPDIEWPPAGTTPPNHTPEEIQQIATRLQQHVERTFPEVVPNAVDPQTPQPGLLKDNLLLGTTSFHIPGGRTGVTFQYDAPGEWTAEPKLSCERDPEAWLCEGTLLPDGSVLVHKRRGGTAEDPFETASTMHFRLDGAVTIVSGYNYDPVIDDEQDPEPRPAVAVSFEQLDAFATDPALAFA
ncbi:hypothetical protein ABT324_28510 [Saccharopolyspora sp. NPDC000359]|uniref:hypothetical protein n=1 Tax=Saccharopolyspora sp. NPDC000359 TaxID=3154251 RepID=UPI00331B703E